MLKLIVITLLILASQAFAEETSGLQQMKNLGHLTAQDVKEQKLREKLSDTNGNKKRIREIASKIKQIKVFHFENSPIEITN